MERATSSSFLVQKGGGGLRGEKATEFHSFFCLPFDDMSSFFRASTVCVVAGASSTHLSSFRLLLLIWVGRRVGGCPGGGSRSPWGALSGTDRRGAGARTPPEAAAPAVDSVGSPTEARGEKGGRRKQQWTDGNKSTRNKMLQIAQGNELHPSTARIRAARCQ